MPLRGCGTEYVRWACLCGLARNAVRARARLAQLTLLIVAARAPERDAPSAADFEIGREKTAGNALFGHSNFHPQHRTWR